MGRDIKIKVKDVVSHTDMGQVHVSGGARVYGYGLCWVDDLWLDGDW